MRDRRRQIERGWRQRGDRDPLQIELAPGK